MKRLTALLLALLLTFGAFPTAGADYGVYQIGDKIEDFTVTLSDGTVASLYGLLAEKKAVLINFWASWCEPCRREFPALAEAYAGTKDEIGVISLTIDGADTDETVLQMRELLELNDLPMGVDGDDLSSRFSVSAIPASVLIDRNGILCLVENGTNADPKIFRNLFQIFTGDDYETTVLEELPGNVYEGSRPTPDSLKAALCPESSITFRDSPNTFEWPFVPDGEGVSAANGAYADTTAVLVCEMEAKAGEKLAYSVKTECLECFDALMLELDGTIVKCYTGCCDWADDYLEFPSDGCHELRWIYEHVSLSAMPETAARIRNLHNPTEEETAAIDLAALSHPAVLEGDGLGIELVGEELREIVVGMTSPVGDVYEDTCLYLEHDPGTVTMRISVGPEVNCANAFLTGTDVSRTMLCHLPRDDRGFLYEETTDLGYSPFLDETGLVEILLYDSFCPINDNPMEFSFIVGQKGLASFAGLMKTYGYTDEPIIWRFSDSDEQHILALSGENAEGSREILVTDGDGNPIEGVMLQFCDDSVCQVLLTDTDGVCSLPDGRIDWEIHVLNVPAGYAKPDAVYTMSPSGGKLRIILDRA